MRLGPTALLLAACAPDARYDLTITPIVPANLDFDDDADLTLVNRTASGDALHPLGSGVGPFEELPPLGAGAVGLLVGAPGSANAAYDPATVLGYGESPLAEDLGEGEALELRVLIGELAGVGDLGAIARRKAPLLGAAAMAADGRVTLFGGQFNGAPHAAIHALSDVREGNWTATELGGMPELAGGRERVLHTATTLEDGLVLVAGGRPVYLAISAHLPSAFLWDPVAGEVGWSAANARSPGRSQHAAVPMRDGRVLVVGGWTGAGAEGDQASFQFFDPVERRFGDGGTTSAGALGPVAVSLGADGALVCGGFSFDFDGEALTPTAACDRVSLQGDVIPFPPLPEPLGLAAAAALGDGRVLVAGGVLGPIPIPFEDGFLVGANVGTGTDRAFLYEPGPDAWREVGPLREARAAAAAIPTGDGRAVVVGGAREAGAMISEDAGPVFCAELFDPQTGAFDAPGACSTPGSGAFPLVALQPHIGAFVVEGHLGEDADERGGQSYGFIGVAPTL